MKAKWRLNWRNGGGVGIVKKLDDAPKGLERAAAAQLANFHNYESNDNSRKKKASAMAI